MSTRAPLPTPTANNGSRWTAVDESDLMDGDVTVDVSHSTMNSKGALALTGSSPVVRR